MPNQRKSIRLKEYNYASAGAYFITLVTWKRRWLFGHIAKDEMQLNQLGQIIHDQWLLTTELRSEIIRDEFIVMPNHFHAIVFIDRETSSTASGRPPVAPTADSLLTGLAKKSLGSLVGGFKAACTRELKRLKSPSNIRLWQRNYFERIIRNEGELHAVREYIQNNPLNWQLDPENT
jgi:putative transposase